MLCPKVVHVEPLPAYKLLLRFDTDENKIFDVTPYISGEWFGMLAEDSYFKTVHIRNHTVVWADGQDIAPHELYDASTIFR